MKYIIIILLVIIFLCLIYKCKNKEYYCDYQSNYANDIYGIRPPYKMAKKFNPDKLGPFRILKNNFLNHPIEGFSSKIEGFSMMDILKGDKEKINDDDTKDLENGMAKMRGEIFPKMSDNEKYTRELVQKINENNTNQDTTLLNMKIQTQIPNNIEKKEYQKQLQKFKYFNNEKCLDSNGTNDGYNYTGAFFQSNNAISCNNDIKNNFRRCKVKVVLKQGKVDKIDVLDCGSGYINPDIEILANDSYGTGAKAKLEVNEQDGSIKFIEILDGGVGYKEIPTVNIKNSVETNKCYLCTK